MPLESTILCLDNSEWMRNGDYVPTRLDAQHDAANMLCGAKTQSNPESTVGVLTMAGKGVDVLVSPTDDMGKLLSSLSKIPIGGNCKFANSMQVAQLALKHRINRKGSQRIIIFVGSPISDDTRSLTKMGKLLKKNNVAIDVVSFGDIDVNQEKLQALIDAANSNSNSHLVTVPPGVLPSDVLVSSPIVHGGESGDAGAVSSSGGNDFSEYGGVDPSMDPELALALRVSMEEERARQERESKKKAETEGASGDAEKSATDVKESKTPASSSSTSGATETATEEDDALQRALQMSLESSGSKSPEKSSTESKSESKGAPPPAPASTASSTAFLDPTFVNSLLSGLPGVDPNDPKIQAAMAQITNKSNEDKGKDDKGDEKKDQK